ncbi:MAG: alpha/beta fold hydrolase [Coleofasciculus sp. A1-SPW-01]|uniref:esterase/lipase family protein n=1 Tax=Coleofasciculus sp. A1-SPW-01 TaxID=3070819 RepID=UPI0032F43404
MTNGLSKISNCDNPGRRGDVIFVHGLGGDALKTWHPQGKRDSEDSWLYWLSQDIPNVAIWSLGYEAEPFAWRGSTMPLVDRATNTLALLDADDIGERPVVFITHSLGGLLVKQMLRHAMDFGEQRWRTIVEQTKGIVFLSTPHSGSDLANWVKYIGGILQTTVSVDELEAHHSRLRELNLLYRNHEKLSQIPMQVYCEKKKTQGILVVNETSADPGVKGVTPIPMDDDHLSICRPLSRESQIYKRVKRFISDYLTYSQPIKLEPKASSIEQLTIDNRRIGNYFEKNAKIYGVVISRNWLGDDK